jgi:hypothetical protein
MLQWPLPARFLLEWLLIAVPSLLTMTVLAGYSLHVLLAQVSACVALHLIALTAWGAPIFSLQLLPQHSLWMLMRESRRSFISNFRSGMMLLTCVAILAVDFRVFPRRFAKTETFGTSVVSPGFRAPLCCPAAGTGDVDGVALIDELGSWGPACGEATAGRTLVRHHRCNPLASSRPLRPFTRCSACRWTSA